MNEQEFSKLFDALMTGNEEAFVTFAISLTTSTQVWLETYLGYTGTDAEQRAHIFVEDVMNACASSHVQELIQAQGGLTWLRQRRRGFFLPHFNYVGSEGQRDADEEDVRTSFTGTPPIQRFLKAAHQLGEMPRELLRALLAADPHEEIRRLAAERKLTVADIRIHLSAAAKALASFFKNGR